MKPKRSLYQARWPEVRDVEHAVAEALDVRGAGRDALERVAAGCEPGVVGRLRSGTSTGRDTQLGHHFDRESVRIFQPHDGPAAGLGVRSTSPPRISPALRARRRAGTKPETRESGLPRWVAVHEGIGARGARVERRLGAERALEPEVGEKRFMGRGRAPKRTYAKSSTLITLIESPPSGAVSTAVAARMAMRSASAFLRPNRASIKVATR